MVRHLPVEQRKRALLYGLGGAFVFRFIAILVAATLIRIWWLQAIGALYLLYLPIGHFVSHGRGPKPKKADFWKTVIAVELADITFAMDSVLAGVAVIRGSQDK